MAVVHKVSEKLFLISWTNAVYANEGKVEIELNGVVQSCKFSYTVLYNHTTRLHELKVEVDISLAHEMIASFTSWEEVTVLAIKDGVQNIMTSDDNLKWATSFAKAYRCCQLPLIIDFLIDIGTESAIAKKMTVINHINHLWNAKLLTDVTFKCKDKLFKAHSLMVASASPILATMLTVPDSKEGENKEKTVEIKETIPEVFEQLLRFTYTGDVDFKVADPADLFVAADKYAIDSLKKLCAEILAKSLTVENASHYLTLAHLHSSPELYQSTLEFISENAKAVCSQKNWFEIIKKYPELCFAAMQLMFMK